MSPAAASWARAAVDVEVEGVVQGDLEQVEAGLAGLPDGVLDGGGGGVAGPDEGVHTEGVGDGHGRVLRQALFAPVIRATISSPVVSAVRRPADAPAGAHHPDLVAEAHDLGEVVADQQYGVALVAQPDDELLDPGGLLHAEGGGRLVHDHEPGAETGGAADRDGLPLPAGQAPDPAVHRGHVDGQGGRPSSAASRCMPRRSRIFTGPMPRTSSRLRKRFCQTVRSSTRARFWWTVSMPSSRASSGDVKCSGLPSMVMVPACGWWMPEMQRTRVDLPAPLSPTRAVISPWRRVRETSTQGADAAEGQ